jgi:hypothetical protein
MNITLSWNNLNTAPTQLDIYRSTDPLVPSGNRTLIGSDIDAAALTHSDNTVVYGTTYYYQFVSKRGVETTNSRIFKVVAVSNTGPGPQRLTHGDLGYGYYGVAQVFELPSTEQLAVLSGIALDQYIRNPQPIWDKWSLDGKTLFVPRMVLAERPKWQDIYHAGAVYGDDTTGPAGIVGVTPTAQSAKIVHGNKEYRIRLMGAINRNLNDVADATALTDVDYYRTNSEVALLKYPLTKWVPNAQEFENILQLANADMGGATTVTTAGSIVLSKSLNSAKTHALNILAGLETTAGIQAFSSISFNGTSPNTAYQGWMPVLELTDRVIAPVGGV